MRSHASIFRQMFIALMMSVLVFAIAACATNNGGASETGTGTPAKQNLTPQQVIAIVCPPLTTALVQIQNIYAVQADLGNAQAAKVAPILAKVQPIVAQTCAVNAAVSTASVQDFANTVLPALARAAASLPLTPKQLSDVQIALLTAQMGLGVYNVVQSQMAAQVPETSTSVAK